MSDCQTVRAGLLLRDLGQLDGDPAIAAHVASCARCAADLHAVRTATRDTAERLDSQMPLGNPAALTQTILDRAVAWREQRARGWRRASLSLATLAIAAWVLIASGRAAPLRAALGFPDPPYVTTVLLSCLTPGDAAGAARPYLRSRGSAAEPGPGGVASVTLTGERSEVAQAEIAVAKLDGRLGPPPGACAR